MIISNISPEQLEAALRATNRKHGYRLQWNRRPEPLNAKKTRFIATIRSAFSKIKGARTSNTGRNLTAASWHAHGHFFEEVLAYSPDAVIRASRSGAVINKEGGNWQDFNVGSQMYPAMMSELSVGE